MSKRSRMILACLCGVLAAALCLLYANGVREEVERERSQTLRRYGGDMVSLVVSRRTIEVGEVLTLGDVETRDWISSLAPDDAILDVEDAIGREVSVPLAKNAPLTELNFRNTSELAEIPSGHVALSVPLTDKLGVPSGVSAGSRVVAYKSSEGAAELIAATAIVLSVPSSSTAPMGKGSLTIAVVPDEVTGVLSASATGDLRLVMPADDVKKIPESAKKSNDVEPVDEAEVRADASTQSNVTASETKEEEHV